MVAPVAWFIPTIALLIRRKLDSYTSTFDQQTTFSLRHVSSTADSASKSGHVRAIEPAINTGAEMVASNVAKRRQRPIRGEDATFGGRLRIPRRFSIEFVRFRHLAANREVDQHGRERTLFTRATKEAILPRDRSDTQRKLHERSLAHLHATKATTQDPILDPLVLDVRHPHLQLKL